MLHIFSVIRYIYIYISVHRCGTCVLRSKNNIFIKIYITVPKIINTLHKSTITVAFKDLREISEEPEGNTLEILQKSFTDLREIP